MLVSAGRAEIVDLSLVPAPLTLGQVVVSAARTSGPAATLPTSLQVVSGDALVEQATVSTA